MKTYVWAHRDNLTNKIAAHGLTFDQAYEKVSHLFNGKYFLFSIEKQPLLSVKLVPYEAGFQI